MNSARICQLSTRPYLQTPTIMPSDNFYDILGIAPDADPDAIKRAYRQLARRYHPDVSDAADAEEKFKQVQHAYEVLKDPDKRAVYDQFGRDPTAAYDVPPP
tara:strand:- start:327 stop:632 length:306 start_codon:yes stop_codon:yes gene_type:complete